MAAREANIKLQEAYLLNIEASDLESAKANIRSISETSPSDAIRLIPRLIQKFRWSKNIPEAKFSIEFAERIVEQTKIPYPDWLVSESLEVLLAEGNWKDAFITATLGLEKSPRLIFPLIKSLVLGHKIDAAISRLPDAANFVLGNTNQAPALANTCRLVLQYKSDRATQDIIISILCDCNSGHFDVTRLLAKIYYDCGYWRKCADSFKLLQKHGKDLTSQEYNHYAVSAIRGDLSADEFVPIFDYCLNKNPNDPELVRIWSEEAKNRKLNLVKIFTDIQNSSSHIIPSVIVSLLDYHDISWIKDSFSSKIEKFFSTPEISSAKAFIDGCENLSTDLSGNAATFSLIPSTKILCLLYLMKDRQISYPVSRSARSSALHCLNSDRIDLLIRKIVGEPRSFWKAYLDSAEYSSPAAKRHVYELERFVSYQDLIMESGNLVLPDPFGPGQATIIDSFIRYGQVIYTFRGKYLFYMVTCSAGSMACYIYVPFKNLVIDLGPHGASERTEKKIAFLYALYLNRLANHYSLYKSKVEDQRKSVHKFKVIGVAGRIENYAHQVWNFLSGFERFIINKTQKSIDKIISATTQYYGSANDIFAEYGHASSIHVKNTQFIDPCPFSHSHVVIQAGGYFIPRILVDRIIEYAQKKYPELDKFLCTSSVNGKKIIWIGFRIGDKSWAQQEDGLPCLMKILHESHPSALLVLDSFTFPEFAGELPKAWLDFYRKIGDISSSIVEKSGISEEHLHSICGKSLYESVLWANYADLYITPLGTTQHKVGWFTKGAGLIYASSELAAPPELRVGAWEAEGMKLPTFIDCEPIDGGTRRGSQDMRANLSNINVDPRVIADAAALALRLVKTKSNQ
ncbi:hypothetical protein [Pseudoroseomonas sp. WGS1072]|uniref:hypothetical protein n=1 Tax=Roseomonas sp. WGS1072 TaxID=3366816 RepID=UPI003BF3B918